MAITTRSSAEIPRRLFLSAALVAAASFSGVAIAQDLGNYGNVWGIQEQDAIDMLKSKLSAMQKSGEMDKIWGNYRDRYIDRVENPEPLPGISSTMKERSWNFDPTYTFPDDVRDTKGNLLVKAGTKANPLQYTPLTKSLIFIDGRDPAQVAYAKARTDANPRDKVILTAGSFLKLNRAWKRVTYFDQRGILTTRFGIKHVPAIVAQEGSVLRVKEFIAPPVQNGGSK